MGYRALEAGGERRQGVPADLDGFALFGRLWWQFADAAQQSGQLAEHPIQIAHQLIMNPVGRDREVPFVTNWVPDGPW